MRQLWQNLYGHGRDNHKCYYFLLCHRYIIIIIVIIRIIVFCITLLLEPQSATEKYPGNPEFSREHNLNLLSESISEGAIYSLPDSPGPGH